MELTKQDIEELINLEKFPEKDIIYEYPKPGNQQNIPLESSDGREKFLLDISRASINLQKLTFQNRAKVVIQLVRLDLGGPEHRNPDGERVSSPHIHIYKTGYGDKWAYPANEFLPESVLQSGNIESILAEFMSFCKIVRAPKISFDLFSSL